MSVVLKSPDFCPDSWVPHFERLAHLCVYDDALLCVTGAEGVGKTTFAQQFKAHDHGFYTQTIQVNAQMTPNDVMHAIGAVFDLDWVGHTPGHAANTGRILALCVDDADTLSDEALYALAHVGQQQGLYRLRVILIGSAALALRLHAAPLKSIVQDQCHVVNLAPWSEAESIRFITAALHENGYPHKTLGQKVMRRLYQHAQGYPARINDLLPIHMAQQTHSSTLSPSIWAGIGIGLIMGAMALLYFFEPSADTAWQMPTPLVDKTTQPIEIQPMQHVGVDANE